MLKLKNPILGLCAVASSLFLAGCFSDNTEPPMTSLQIQSFQRKQFDGTKRVVFASTMSVFQDMGYTISSASFETGFITAQSPAVTTGSALQAQLFGIPVVSEQTKATATIEEITPTVSSLRLNFVDTTTQSTSTGQNSMQDRPILDPNIYTMAFVKIQEAIFIRQATQSKVTAAVAPTQVPSNASATPEVHATTS